MLNLIFEDDNGKELWIKADAVNAVAWCGSHTMILVADKWISVKGDARQIMEAVNHVQQNAPLLDAIMRKQGSCWGNPQLNEEAGDGQKENLLNGRQPGSGRADDSRHHGASSGGEVHRPHDAVADSSSGG